MEKVFFNNTMALILFMIFFSCSITKEKKIINEYLENGVVFCYDCSSLSSISDTIYELHIFAEKCHLDNDIHRFKRLESLRIISSELDFADNFEGFGKIFELYIYNYDTDELMDYINLTPGLEKLYVSLKDIRSINRLNLLDIKELIVISGSITQLPSNIFNFKDLIYLQLITQNENDRIPYEEKMLKLESLEHLDSPINLKDWMNIIQGLGKLKYIGVNNVDGLTDNEILSLKGLKTIYSEKKTGLNRIKKLLPNIEIERR